MSLELFFTGRPEGDIANAFSVDREAGWQEVIGGVQTLADIVAVEAEFIAARLRAMKRLPSGPCPTWWGLVEQSLRAKRLQMERIGK